MGTLQGLINRAEKELGYIEKKSNSNLDSKTANKGTNNYTKYARDISNKGLMGCQGQAWCSTFQFWLEVQEFGLDVALKHWHMTKSSYVGYNVFSTRNKFPAGKKSSTPQLGALVIFKRSHVGRVVKIVGNVISVIEGNTSAKMYDNNGGQVEQKLYNITDSQIDCFCIIDYSTSNDSGDTYKVKLGDTLSKIANMWNISVDEIVKFNGLKNPNLINIGQVIKKPTVRTPEVPKTNTNSIIKMGQTNANSYAKANIKTDGIFGTDSKKAGIKCIQHACNLDYKSGITEDGIWGAKTEKAIKGHTVRQGEVQHMVRALQINLALRGYDPKGIDAIFGSGLKTTLIAYQKDNGLSPDGIAGINTFKTFK